MAKRAEELGARAARLGRLIRRAAERQAVRVRARLSAPRARLVFDARYRLPENELVDEGRAQKILDYLELRGWLSRKDVLAPPPLTMQQLLRVHDRAYLEGLDDPRNVSSVFGETSLTREKAASLLIAQRWATSGTVLAARLALGLSTRRGTLVKYDAWRRKVQSGPFVNLGGGLHHAHRDHGAGFCAFNDLAVAIGELRSEGFEGNILIVDLDMHHGDGTRAFFAKDRRVHTYSLHATTWDASPAVSALDVEIGPAIGDATYLRSLRETLPAFFSTAAPELVFYVAGVDAAHDDRLGGYRLSENGIFERDRYVFELAGKLPLVMVLAGGYGPEAWRYTARTLYWLLSGEDRPVLSRDELSLRRFRRIRMAIGERKLSTDFDKTDGFELTQADVYGDLFERGEARDPRLLGFYSPYGMELAFERYGLADLLRARGYPDFELAMDAVPTSGQGLRVYADSSKKEVLVELVVTDFYGVSPFKLLSIEWLLMQDPRQKPELDHELLPGQHHPGLGALNIVVGMLIMACERLGFDGLTFVPAHFHLAARARRILKVLSPSDEALFLALASATATLASGEASRRIESGAVIDSANGGPVRYVPMRMVLPVSKVLKDRLESPEYARGVEESAKGFALRLSEDAVG